MSSPAHVAGLLFDMELYTFTLPNGIRVIHKEVAGAVGHIGLIINAGSRDEAPEEQGLAHYIEHTIFKGTKKRRAYHILSRLEDVGGELNAYTSKEETIIYASILAQHYDRAVELLFDIAFNSVFPEKEIKKEVDVITDEINSYLDSPSDLIFDDFEDLLYDGHPIGRNILGTTESLKTFNRDSILNFIKKNYNTDEMVLSSVGAISGAKLRKLIEKYGMELPSNPRTHARQPINGYQPRILQTSKDTYQTHAIIGNRAYDVKHEKLTGMVLLNNLLGGPGMNSRLNLNIREKYGFAYNIESFYTPYSDTGVFGVYVGTDKGTMKKSLQLIEKELNKLRAAPLGTLQLAKAKTQLVGQLALGQENNGSLMIAIGKNYLTFNKVDTFQEMKSKIEAVTAEELLDVANEVFDVQQLSQLIYKAK